MSVGTVVLAAVTLILGGALSWYFSIRLKKPDLATHLEFGSAVFAGVKSDIQEDLALTYRGQPVEDLYHMEITVMNRGQKAISDCVEPLSLRVPDDSVVLDVSITDTSNTNLTVNVKSEVREDSRVLAFPFPLLNTGDWFKIKLLFEGSVEPEELKFEIRTPDVPSTLSLQTDWKDHSTWIRLVGGFVLGLGGGILSTKIIGYAFNVDSVVELPWYVNVPSFIVIGIVVVALGLPLLVLIHRVSNTIWPAPPGDS